MDESTQMLKEEVFKGAIYKTEGEDIKLNKTQSLGS